MDHEAYVRFWADIGPGIFKALRNWAVDVSFVWLSDECRQALTVKVSGEQSSFLQNIVPQPMEEIIQEK